MKKYLKKYLWTFTVVAIVAVAVLAALAVRGLMNLGADDGTVSGARPKAGTGSSPSTGVGRECVGTRPVDSLPHAYDDDSPLEPLERVVARVDKLADADRYAAVYTGLSLDEDSKSVDVWRVPSAAFDTEVCGSVVKGVTVRLHGTDVDRRTLDALADRLGDDMRRWDGTFQMREVGVDERGFVLVGVDDPDTARPIVEKAYGAENARYIKVEHVDQASALTG
ncbi:hypothetical protein [Streptomyces sp. MBT62]|uniref:hypothetical protein n=1 Tax=Streptomyces sp. MBT62 TaxID=2800410 RepID=UPI00190AFDB0|nr:hypothetical protein [Streptomyces sp. MBT62]MBK3569696.1 hypothetical protein [Streptomyces sp. MBT62]